MISTATYRCPRGCTRETAAPLHILKVLCETHREPWALVAGSERRFRTHNDPPGTPLVEEVKP